MKQLFAIIKMFDHEKVKPSHAYQRQNISYQKAQDDSHRE
jgi:hypothetical protein